MGVVARARDACASVDGALTPASGVTEGEGGAPRWGEVNGKALRSEGKKRGVWGRGDERRPGDAGGPAAPGL